MDPLTHTFTGGLLAAGGLRKAAPLATAALLIGANAPDIDIVASWTGEYASLAHRRGWTHGILAWGILPLLIASGLVLWDRLTGTAQPATRAHQSLFWPLYGISLLGVLTHPFLDWLNNYGIRLLMPFDSRWFYGDTLFIVDPWIWLILGGAWFLVSSNKCWQQVLWAIFWLAASALISLNNLTSPAVLVMWYTGLLAIAVVRVSYKPKTDKSVARWSLAVAFGYIAANNIAGLVVAEHIDARLSEENTPPPVDVMVSPVAANPFRSIVVVRYHDHYQKGEWDWLASTRLVLSQRIPDNRQSDIVTAASVTQGAKQFLSWSRYPFADIVQNHAGGYTVSFKDARYSHREGTLEGPTVILAPDLRVIGDASK